MTSFASSTLPITVVILTKNEEEVLAGAIDSVISDYAEVVVLDSYSDDRTIDIAERLGARVVQNSFVGYASQRNFALNEMQRVTDWIFFLDADERISHALTAELHLHFGHQETEGVGMFFMRRKDFFMGRWIRRSSGYPTWFGRLCHAPSVHVEREINEEYHCARPTARLSEHLLHYPFAKGLGNWLDRHNRYSTAESQTMARGDGCDPNLVFSIDPGLRRKGLKQIYMRLPFRPLVGFLYLYILRGGFLDGGPGLRYAMLRAFYEMIISIKVEEIRAKNGAHARPTSDYG